MISKRIAQILAGVLAAPALSFGVATAQAQTTIPGSTIPAYISIQKTDTRRFDRDMLVSTEFTVQGVHFRDSVWVNSGTLNIIRADPRRAHLSDGTMVGFMWLETSGACDAWNDVRCQEIIIFDYVPRTDGNRYIRTSTYFWINGGVAYHDYEDHWYSSIGDGQLGSYRAILAVDGRGAHYDQLYGWTGNLLHENTNPGARL